MLRKRLPVAEKTNKPAPQAKQDKPSISFCPQLSGTIFRLYVPPGFVFNIFNTIEISSRGGICLDIRLLP
jgi:hypothetical protein